MSPVEPLFRPFSGGGLRLRNRLVMAPMTRHFSPGHVPGADVAAYYRRRAEGGAGLIVTEGTGIPHPAALDAADLPQIALPGPEAGWRRVVEGVQAAGARIVPQLWHQGPLRDPGAPGASMRPSGHWGRAGVTSYDAAHLRAVEAPTRPMSESDIADVIEAFGQGAAAARRIGFDGVAIHGAHGYLIDAFLWPGANRRTDRWGATAEGRLRFAVAVVERIRKAVGPGFPVIFRFSQHKQQDYTARLAETPVQLAALLAPLAQAGVDIFDASARRFWEPAFEGSDRTLAGWARHLTGCPVIAVGSFGFAPAGDAGRAAALIASGEIDLVAVGRQFLQHPDLPDRLRRGLRLEAYDPASRARLA